MSTDEEKQLSIRVCPARADAARQSHPRVEHKRGHDRHVQSAAKGDIYRQPSYRSR